MVHSLKVISRTVLGTVRYKHEIKFNSRPGETLEKVELFS